MGHIGLPSGGSGSGGPVTDDVLAGALGPATATAMAGRAELKAAYVPLRSHKTPSPLGSLGQYSSGRVTCGVDAALGKLWVYNSSGLGQVDALTSTAFSILTLPANVSPVGQAAKVVTYTPPSGANAGTKLMFLLCWNSSTSRYEVYSAAPGLKTVAPTWSSVLLQFPANATLIPTAFRATSGAIFAGTYTSTADITGGPVLYRSVDGITWTAVLSPGPTTRHCHGVYEDPYNPGTIYSVWGDFMPPYTPAFAVYRSTDSGATWTGVSNLAAGTWQAVSMGFTPDWVWLVSDQSQGGGPYLCDRATLTPRWATTKGRHDGLAVPGGTGGRVVTDLATTSGTGAVASPQAAFVAALDVGRYVRGPNTLPIGAYITSVPTTTIAAASNATVLPQGTITVASTTGFASAGAIAVATASGTQTVTYTGVTATTFTGCTGGTGTLATGGSVVQAILSAVSSGTLTATAQVSSDSFYANAYAGAIDPATGWLYAVANDASNAGNTAGIFVLTGPDEPWTLLYTIPFAQIGNHEAYIAGGYLWIDRYGPMPLLQGV